MSVFLGDIPLKNPLIASSSPLTESMPRLRSCCAAGFAAAILKTAAPYKRSGAAGRRKVVHIGEGFYADAPFQREILTLEEGLALYREASALNEQMRIIPSVSATSLDAAPWVDTCGEFSRLGAEIIQLDLFYLGAHAEAPDFHQKLRRLFSSLRDGCSSRVMPKLNVHFQPDEICTLLSQCGIEYVSLLDSVREMPPGSWGMHPETTSYFGPRQLPLTMRYLAAAVKQQLHVCAGGGINSPADVNLLLDMGAEVVQTASYVLNNGFQSTSVLLPALPPAPDTERPLLLHGTWCDLEDGGTCEQCGACGKVPGLADFSSINELRPFSRPCPPRLG